VQAQTWSPAGIFGTHVRYVVPLFQRPYVWTEEDQWQPLWDDIRTVTEQVLDGAPVVFGASGVAPHFLGAIVLEQQQIPSGFIAVRHVVDGQQRLTTLQLVLDAAQLVVQRHGAPMDAQALRVLADKAYAHPSTRKALRERRIKATIPERADQIGRRKVKGSAGGRPPAFDPGLYKLRNVVERCFNRLKQFRGLATRYAKRAAYHWAEIILAGRAARFSFGVMAVFF
jgi:transposase